MSNHPRSNTDLPDDELPLGRQPRDIDDIDDIELEPFEDLEDIPIDDPGEAQRSSKSEPDGDGEEEMR